MSHVSLVTGAASGMGRHLVKSLVRRGHRVVATDLSVERLAEVAREDGLGDSVVGAALDVRDEEAWKRALALALDRFGSLDLLLSVAGYLRPGYIHETRAIDVDLHFDVNVKGVAHGLRIVGAHFARQGRGHVVNFGSLASLAPISGNTLYTASKYAVRGLSNAAAQELGRFGVAVTLVMPDAVATPMLDLQVNYPEAALTFSGQRPLTVADIEEVIFDVVLPKRPLEIAVPWDRGLLARISCIVPESAAVLRPLLERKGLAAQAARKRST